MPYIVRASTAAGNSSWDFDEALDATKKAAELLGNGVKGVTVEAPDGRFYRDVEFADMLSNAQPHSANQT